VIETRAYNLRWNKMASRYDRLRNETGCSMNLDLHRVATPTEAWAYAIAIASAARFHGIAGAWLLEGGRWTALWWSIRMIALPSNNTLPCRRCTLPRWTDMSVERTVDVIIVGASLSAALQRSGLSMQATRPFCSSDSPYPPEALQRHHLAARPPVPDRELRPLPPGAAPAFRVPRRDLLFPARHGAAHAVRRRPHAASRPHLRDHWAVQRSGAEVHDNTALHPP